ncbi:hypothetical protein G9A89_009411 [Geosiphon pyriformis]|nr:hypothetical protein G9A89_009411 [Geosiphon pyriformis]
MNSLVKDPEIRVEFYILSNSLPEGHDCQNKSGLHTEKEIGRNCDSKDYCNYNRISSKQAKVDLLGTYRDYFEGFKSQLPTPSGFQSPPHQPDFGTTSPWEVTKSEEKEDKNQEFNYQNSILQNLEIETLNIQTPSNQNPNLIHQQNLFSVIVINQPPIKLISEPIQSPQVPPQQPIQPVQQMAYAAITKIEKFTGEEDDAQVWLNDIEKAIVANRWNDACALQAIPYFLQDTANL